MSRPVSVPVPTVPSPLQSAVSLVMPVLLSPGPSLSPGRPVSCQPSHPCLLSPVLGGRWSGARVEEVESQAEAVDLGCYRDNHCNDTLGGPHITISLLPSNSTH